MYQKWTRIMQNKLHKEIVANSPLFEGQTPSGAPSPLPPPPKDPQQKNSHTPTSMIHKLANDARQAYMQYKSSLSNSESVLKSIQYMYISLFLLYFYFIHLIATWSYQSKMLSLVNWCFNRESKTYLCTSVKAGFFSNKKYDSYKCWSCAELCEAFNFLMANIYVQFDGIVYQQIVGIPMGTNCAPLIADLFLYCYERDFMSGLQKSKRFDLIDMVQRYLSISWRYFHHR